MAKYSKDYLEQRYNKLKDMFRIMLPLGIVAVSVGFTGFIPTIILYIFQLMRVIEMESDPSFGWQLARVIITFVSLMAVCAILLILGTALIVIRNTLIRVKMNHTKRALDEATADLDGYTEVVDNPEVVDKE